VSCAETAESIDLPFELGTQVGRRKQEFNRIRQMAPMCTISIVFARWRQRTRQHSAVSGPKTAEPIDLPFGLWTRVGRRKHKFNHIRQVAQCAHMEGHIWRHLANTIEPSACGGDAVICQITFTTCSEWLPPPSRIVKFTKF